VELANAIVIELSRVRGFAYLVNLRTFYSRNSAFMDDECSVCTLLPQFGHLVALAVSEKWRICVQPIAVATFCKYFHPVLQNASRSPEQLIRHIEAMKGDSV